MYGPPPSRLLLVLAGGLTQIAGAAYLILGLASLPIANELHGGVRSVAVSMVAALATVVCGTLVHRGKMVAIALAVGLTVGLGVALVRGTTAIGALLHLLPAAAAENIAMIGAIAMFSAASLCIFAIPIALRIRAWARQGLEPASYPLGGSPVTVEGSGDNAAEQASGGAAADETRSESDPGKPDQTLRGVGRARAPATQIIHLRRRSKSAFIIIVAATLVAAGVVVMAMVSGSSSSEVIKMASTDSARPDAAVRVVDQPSHSGVGSAVIDAAPANVPSPSPPSIEDLVAAFHAAIAKAESDDLSRLLDSNVFGFGVGAQDVAQGREPVMAMLRKNIGAVAPAPVAISARFTQTGHDGQVGWFGGELRVGETTFVLSVAAGLREGAWTIFALHVALPMQNATAHRLAYTGRLEIPESIPNGLYDTPLAKAMIMAFSSRPAFVTARSVRPDSLNLGSAPGERIVGDSIKRVFSQLKAKIRLHDAVNAAPIGEHGGWGAANVDYTDVDAGGHQVTQTFRVLAVWLMEDDQWRIVQTQWSNGR